LAIKRFPYNCCSLLYSNELISHNRDFNKEKEKNDDNPTYKTGHAGYQKSKMAARAHKMAAVYLVLPARRVHTEQLLIK